MPYASREDRLACKRRQYASDPEKFRARAKAWRDRNPDYRQKKRIKWKKYRAGWSAERMAFDNFRRKRGLSAAVARAILARKTHCVLCGGLGELHLDHDVPRSRGGSNELSNLQWLCPPCNTGKGALTTAEFLEHIRRITGHLGRHSLHPGG